MPRLSNKDFFLTRLLIGKMNGREQAEYEAHDAAPDSGRSGALSGCGIRFFGVPVSRSISPLKDRRAYRRLLRLAAPERILYEGNGIDIERVRSEAAAAG